MTGKWSVNDNTRKENIMQNLCVIILWHRVNITLCFHCEHVSLSIVNVCKIMETEIENIFL